MVVGVDDWSNACGIHVRFKTEITRGSPSSRCQQVSGLNVGQRASLGIGKNTSDVAVTVEQIGWGEDTRGGVGQAARAWTKDLNAVRSPYFG